MHNVRSLRGSTRVRHNSPALLRSGRRDAKLQPGGRHEGGFPGADDYSRANGRMPTVFGDDGGGRFGVRLEPQELLFAIIMNTTIYYF
ncbi:unnamed protein product [Sphagnum balticum]